MFDANMAGRPSKEPLDHASADRLHAEQTSAILSHTSSMMIANLCNVLVFLADVWNTPQFGRALYWAASVLSVAGYIYFRRHGHRTSSRHTRPRSSIIRRVFWNGLALGSCWAALPLLFFQDARPGAQLLIACLSAGMLCGGAFALAGVPAAAMAFSLPIALASVVTLAISGDVDHGLIAIVLGIYTFVLLKGVFGYAEQLKNRVLTQIDTENIARMRMQNMQADGLSAMGGLATGLAHEINQPLSACGAYLSTARRLLATPLELRSASVEAVLESAAEQNRRAGEIVHHLRAFIMRGEPDKAIWSLHEAIKESLRVFSTEADHEKIDFKLQLNAEDDYVLADKVQIKQVLGNLIKNAAESMKDSGQRKLTIATRNIDAASIRTDVIDTGCGLPEALKPDLFQPFTTTKTSGMGIGLALSRSIIEAHYGKIWAAANPEGGAILSFLLPLANAKTTH